MTRYFLLFLITLSTCFADYMPAFELKELDSSRKTASADLFRNKVSIIVFWNTHCDECIESLEELIEMESDFVKASIPVVTVNFDLIEDLGYARQVAEKSTYPVLRDNTGDVAKAWGADDYSFSGFVLGRDGIVLEKVLDSSPDAAERLREAALQNAAKNQTAEKKPSFPKMPSFPDFSAPAENPLSLSGMGRVRYQRIMTDEQEIHGPYGEPMSSGSDLKFYFTPTLALKVGDHTKAGVTFRATNISSSNIWGAPDYFTNYYMSPFIKYQADNFTFNAGFYRTFLSPLVFMRWDEGDNPPGSGGSEGGCRVCDGLPGGISADNLEDLGPEIGLEGFSANGSFKGFDNRLFYARTLTPDGYCGRYRQHIFGARSSRRTGKVKLAANGLGIVEDVDNCEYYRGGAEEYRQAAIAGLELDFEPVKSIVIGGEYAHAYNEYITPDTLESIKRYKNGDAAYFGVTYKGKFNKWHFKPDIAFIYINNEYDSPYKALSYRSGYQGPRARAEVIWNKTYGGLAFYKYLEQTDTPDSTTAGKQKTIGFGLYRNCPKHPIFSGLYYSKDTGDVKRDVFTFDFSWKPEKSMFIALNLQYIVSTKDEQDKSVSIGSITTGIDF